MEEAALTARIAKLLPTAGLASDRLRVSPHAAGGNNRVFRVDAGGRALVAKYYFRHASDSRDRLDAEFSFLECAREAGIDCVPEPVARDDSNGIGIYEFIEGSKVAPGALASEHIEQAIEFFSHLNNP